MAVISELIKKDEQGTISFGNYELTEKTKKEGFEVGGDKYKVKTFKEITKLEKNDAFVYESVPGTAVFEYKSSEEEISFKVEGYTETSATLELLEDTEYNVFIDGSYAGVMKTNMGGKLVISLDLENGKASEVIIKKQG